MVEESAYLWEFYKWLYERPSYFNQKSSMNNEVPLDLSIKSTNLNKNLKTSHGQNRDVNHMYGVAMKSSTSSEGNKHWTLRHREYAPGLIELIPNTGVFITKAELDRCLKSSRKCTQLARFLTKHIFTKAALKKCLYVGSYYARESLQLDVKMDAQQTRIYHTVKLLLTYGNSQDGVHCVPESWIRMQDPESPLVLVAFPDEPWRVTEERVRNYESSGEDWNLCMGRILYSTNSYSSVIRCPRGDCDREGTCTGSASFDNSILMKLLRRDEIGRSSTFQMEYYRWLREQSNSDESGLLIDNSSLQSEGSKSITNWDIDSDYVPLDLSPRSYDLNQNSTSQN